MTSQTQTRIVYRYPLAFTDEPQQVDVPANPIIRSVGDRPQAALDGTHSLNAWIEHDVDMDSGETPPAVSFIFHVIRTGGQVPAGAEFVTSVTTPPYIWHVYAEQTPLG